MKIFSLVVAIFLLASVSQAGDLKFDRVTQINFERMPVSNVNMFSVYHGVSFTFAKFEFRPLIGLVTFRELGSTVFVFKLTFEFKG